MRPSRLALAALATLALAACKKHHDEPPLTNLDVRGAKAVAVVTDAQGVPSFLAVKPDGTVADVARTGDALPANVPGMGPGLIWVPCAMPSAAQRLASGNLVLTLQWAFGCEASGAPDLRYVKLTAHLDRETGVVTPLPYFFAYGSDLLPSNGAPVMQESPRGTLWTSERSDRPVGYIPPGDLPYTISLDDLAQHVGKVGSAPQGGRGAASGPAADVDGFAAFSLSDVRVIVWRGGDESASVQVLSGQLGTPFTAADGHAYVTGWDERATTLYRVNGNGSLTETAHWSGEDGGPGVALTTWPATLGDALFFVGPTSVVRLASITSPPAQAPLDFAWVTWQASAGAIWFVAEDGSGTYRRLVRWTPEGQEDVMLPDGVALAAGFVAPWDFKPRAWPIDDDEVLVEVVPDAGGASTVLRGGKAGWTALPYARVVSAAQLR